MQDLVHCFAINPTKLCNSELDWWLQLLSECLKRADARMTIRGIFQKLLSKDACVAFGHISFLYTILCLLSFWIRWQTPGVESLRLSYFSCYTVPGLKFAKSWIHLSVTIWRRLKAKHLDVNFPKRLLVLGYKSRMAIKSLLVLRTISNIFWAPYTC